MERLKAINLSKRFDEVTALDNLNLSVREGDIFCLLGPNGAGKTTTINLFMGFAAPTEGQAFINGKLVGENGNLTQKFISYIPEVVMLYDELSALENLDYFCKLAGFKYSTEQLDHYLFLANLQPEANHKRLRNFSKGMRQKVGIAIALAKNADVVFMDEPTSGLDPKATDELALIIKNLGAKGKTVLMATHDIFNAVEVATTIGIMRHGSLVHTLDAKNIDATQLQQLYLETI